MRRLTSNLWFACTLLAGCLFGCDRQKPPVPTAPPSPTTSDQVINPIHPATT